MPSMDSPLNQCFSGKMLSSADGLEHLGEHQMYNPVQNIEDECSGNQTYFFAEENMGGFGDLWSSYDFYNDTFFDIGGPIMPSEQQFSEYADDMQVCTISAATQSLYNPIAPATEVEQILDSLVPEYSELLRFNDEQSSAALSSLELLSNYRPVQNRLNVGKINALINREDQHSGGGLELSTEDIMRIASACFIQMSPPADSNSYMLRNPFGLPFGSLSAGENESIELASLLLSAAEKVSNQQYDRATNLIKECFRLSSNTGNPLQRVVYYFADALGEKIGRETGKFSWKEKNERDLIAEDMIKALQTSHPVNLVTFEKIAFGKIIHFTSIQTILDNVASAKRIHLIDLSIRHGVQWTILMQALATRSSCPINNVKISAIGTSEESINATGKRLISFAESLRLPFIFKAVIVPDVKDLKDNMFDVEEGEAIAVYSSMDMSYMIIRPDRLETVMTVIRKLRPCIMTVAEVEAKHNSPSLINRFTEALFYFSAFFDCLGSCMDVDTDRQFVEERYFSPGIRSIIAAEGNERLVRHVGISVWRSFFARYRLVEAELNQWSSYQASLLVKQFVNGNSYTLEKNGKALLVGWKGTPLHFLSAWKFQ